MSLYALRASLKDFAKDDMTTLSPQEITTNCKSHEVLAKDIEHLISDEAECNYIALIFRDLILYLKNKNEGRDVSTELSVYTELLREELLPWITTGKQITPTYSDVKLREQYRQHWIGVLTDAFIELVATDFETEAITQSQMSTDTKAVYPSKIFAERIRKIKANITEGMETSLDMKKEEIHEFINSYFEHLKQIKSHYNYKTDNTLFTHCTLYVNELEKEGVFRRWVTTGDTSTLKSAIAEKMDQCNSIDAAAASSGFTNSASSWTSKIADSTKRGFDMGKK